MHAVKKILLCTAILLTLTLTQIMTVKATPEPTVEIEPYVSTAQVGQSFTINITLTNVENLAGVDVKLYWNASILKVVNTDVRLGVENHSDGILHQPIFIAENETIQGEGEYWLAGVSENHTSSFNGSGNIVRITFNVISAGSCTLDLAAQLSSWVPPADGNSQPIAATTIPGFFSLPFIGISASPENATLGENINISGFIVPAQANVDVTILYRINGEANWSTLATVTTDEQGNYQFMWQPQADGKYDIRAIAIIDGKEETSDSVSVTVKVPEQNTLSYLVIIIVVVAIVAVVLYFLKVRKRYVR